VKCVEDRDSGRRLISEITLALKGTIKPGIVMGDLVLAAIPDSKPGCPGGIIDPVGLQ